MRTAALKLTYKISDGAQIGRPELHVGCKGFSRFSRGFPFKGQGKGLCFLSLPLTCSTHIAM